MDERSLKILYTASTDRHLRSFHLPYLAALTRRGHRVTAAAAGNGAGLPEGVRFLPTPFTKSMVSPRNLRAAALLARELRREKYDLVLCHTSLAAFFTRLAVRLAGKGETRVVNTVHGYLFDDSTPPLRRAVMLGAEKLMAGVTDDILVMNRADLAIAGEHRLCRGDVRLIPGMGVDTNRFIPAAPEERDAARAALGLAPEAFALLYAAEFSPRKNQAFLIRTMSALPEDTVLLLPGDGALRSGCEELARSLGLEGRVLFPGQVKDTLPYLRAADACVSASRSEGLPFHVMEAMACALPSVLTRVKGHEDLLSGEEAGLLYAFGDADGFIRAVGLLHDSAERRAAMGRAARERVLPYALDRVLPEAGFWGLED